MLLGKQAQHGELLVWLAPLVTSSPPECYLNFFQKQQIFVVDSNLVWRTARDTLESLLPHLHHHLLSNTRTNSPEIKISGTYLKRHHHSLMLYIVIPINPNRWKYQDTHFLFQYPNLKIFYLCRYNTSQCTPRLFVLTISQVCIKALSLNKIALSFLRSSPCYRVIKITI